MCVNVGNTFWPGARSLSEALPDWRLLLALVAGYFLLGIVAVGRSPLAIQALVVFAAAYAAMNLGAFAVVARVGRDLQAFVGFGRASPRGSGALVTFLLSLVGVPPLAGFVGKLLLFGSAIDAGFGWLAVVAIANSVLSLGVYLRLIVPCYQAPSEAGRSAALGPVPAVSLGLVVGLGLGVQALISRIG